MHIMWWPLFGLILFVSVAPQTECFKPCSSFIGGVPSWQFGSGFGKTLCPTVRNEFHSPQMTAGLGFGEPRRKLKLEYGGSAGDPMEQRKRWETSYKAFINRMGKYLTAMSWEGHKRYGRGAIYANNQARPPVKRGEEVAEWKRFGGVPTLYVPQDKYEEKTPQSEQERIDLQQIMSRIRSYDPHREFVIVFEAAGLMGADVVKPSVSPPDMHQLFGEDPKDFDIAEDVNEKVLAEYWRNPGPVDGEDVVDMTPLIMDAMNSEGSVIDITQQLGEMDRRISEEESQL